MSEEPGQIVIAGGKAPSSAPRNCALGCLGLLVLVAVAGGVASSAAQRRLEGRRAAAAERVVALGEELAAPRTPLLQGEGAESDESNALVDYNGLQWVMSHGDVNKVQSAWRQRRPTLPEDVEAVIAQLKGPTDFDYARARGLDEHLDPRVGSPLAPEARAEFERFLPATRYVRAGVTRGRCDWETRWELGMGVETPNLLQLRVAANALAYEATTQEPREALETGLVIVAFGDDVERQGTLIGAMISIAVRAIGCRSLAHTMGRAGLEERDCQRVLDVLARQRWASASELCAREALCGEIAILSLGGRPLEVGGEAEFGQDVSQGLGLLGSLSLFQEREVEAYADFMERAGKICALPKVERSAAWDRLEQDVAGSSYIFSQLAVPNIRLICVNVSESHALSDATRALAAAHLLRLREGAFPAQLSALTLLLGSLPEDPHRPGQPLTYRLEGELLTIYSLGENATDEGGAKGSDDRGFATRVPRAD